MGPLPNGRFMAYRLGLLLTNWDDPPSGGGQKTSLPGGFKYSLLSPLHGEDSNFDYIFFKWVETTT